MKQTEKPVLGVHAPSVRPTMLGATMLACVFSLPVWALLTVLVWLL